MSWKQELAEGFSRSSELLAHLGLAPELASDDAEQDFKTRVPHHFVSLMEPSLDDPLLRQVWAQADETLEVAGFVDDPLSEQQAAAPGVLHKYASRVLMILRGGCAINCRYCFRRAFPYDELTLNRRQRVQALEYIAGDTAINEVILSGGDPLMADDDSLAELIQDLAAIGHVRRVRVHTRLPVVIPNRLTPGLLQALTQTRLQAVLVLHSNHPNEIAPQLKQALGPFTQQMLVLNQSVLLAGVNDDAAVLTRLSEVLFDARIQPYYLFLLDRVRGAAHFEVDQDRALELYADVQTRLPGFLLPRLAREIPDKPSKTLVLGE